MYDSKTCMLHAEKKNSTEKIRPTKLQQYKIEKLIQFVLNVYVVL